MRSRAHQTAAAARPSIKALPLPLTTAAPVAPASSRTIQAGASTSRRRCCPWTHPAVLQLQLLPATKQARHPATSHRLRQSPRICAGTCQAVSAHTRSALLLAGMSRSSESFVLTCSSLRSAPAGQPLHHASSARNVVQCVQQPSCVSLQPIAVLQRV